MGILEWLFGKGEDREAPDTSGMVKMTSLAVVPSYTNFVEEFPRLREITTDQYDFFMTAAAVSCALAGIEMQESERVYETALRQAEDELREMWGSDGPRAVADCHQFIARSLSGSAEADHPDALPGAVGMWIVWNLFQEQPRDEDLGLVSVTGRMAVALSSEWWK